MKPSGVFGKKAVALFVVLAVASIVAAGVTFAGGDGKQAKSISLEQAVDLAMENNYDLKLAKLATKKADKEYRGAKDGADKLKSELIQTYEAALGKYVNPRAKLADLNIAKEQEKLTEKAIQVNVESDYYTVLKTKKLVGVKEQTLKYAKDQLKIAQESYKLGTIAKGDVVAVEALVAGSEAALAAAKNDYERAVMRLNEKIGLDIETDLVLTDKFQYSPMKEVDVNEEVYKALETNVEIVKAREQQAVAEKQYEIASKYLGGGVTVYETAKITAEMADIGTKKQEVATRLAVKESYMKIKALEKQIAFQQKEVEKQKEVLRITMLKFKAGLVTNQDVRKTTLDYEEAELKLAESIYSYNTLKSSFKYGLFGSVGN